MKKTITILCMSFSFFVDAQVFTGVGGNIRNDGQDTFFDISVSGLSPAQISNTFGVEEVCVNIIHPTVEELYIYLQSPDGIMVELTEGSSCNGSDYTNTCFNNHANTSVTLATAPYTGSYKPTGSLGRFNNGQTGNGTWRLIVHDYLAFVNSGSVVSWSINFTNTPIQPVVFTSSNLPIVVINTNNQQLSDVKTLVNMGVIYNGINQTNNLTDAMNNYNDKTNIHFRGNTSKNFEKKPYTVETTDGAGNGLKVSLLGMPNESDWDLIAMYQDKSLIRVPFTYDIARQMGDYAPRFKTVEVVLNGEYRGVYSLMEKIKRGKYRVNISKLTNTDNAFPAITGGYIFKIDRTDAAGWYSKFPGNTSGNVHFYYNYVYPQDTAITIQQKAYIKSFMDTVETLFKSSTFNNPKIGYQKYIDINSFVDFFIINELSKNVDAYRLSTFLYKDNIVQGGKLHIGPVWDYDLAWHNCNYGGSFDYNGWEYQIQDTVHPTPSWWPRFFQDTNFVDKLYCRWHELRQNVLSINNMNAYIDSSVNALNESQQRNFIQWPILGAYIFPNPQNQTNATYQTEVNDFKIWIANRVAWMDGAIYGHCPPPEDTTIIIGITENSFNNSVIVYPNPFEYSTTFEINLMEDSNVSLKIFDLMGKEIALLANGNQPSGELKIVFERKERASGIYFYQLKINNEIKTGKIIIQ